MAVEYACSIPPAPKPVRKMIDEQILPERLVIHPFHFRRDDLADHLRQRT